MLLPRVAKVTLAMASGGRRVEEGRSVTGRRRRRDVRQRESDVQVDAVEYGKAP